MPRIVPKPAIRGSQKWLQILVNKCPEVLSRDIASHLNLAPSEQVHWLTPLAGDDYAEYQDEAFLSRLDVQLEQRPLASFWPRRGPVWDGLGVTDRGDLLLVEAKSHIPELLSTAAASELSLARIQASLNETKNYLGVNEPSDWTTPFYQYANRLAHLYLLRVLNKLPAYLVFVYFVNDHEQHGPTTQAEWEEALAPLKSQLGVYQHRLSSYVLDVYIDVTTLVRDVGGRMKDEKHGAEAA